MAVFISYRREDSEGDSRALYNRLAAETDESNLFLDFAAISPGDDWRARITENLDKVQAVVVVIGPKWLEILNARASTDTHDEVRRELSVALAKPGLRILPILVKGARMPSAGDLPPELQILSSKNALEVRGSAWDSDVNRVVNALRRAKALPTSRRTWAIRAAVAAGLGAFVAGFLFARVEVPAVPKNMSHKYAKVLVESHGLKFKPRVLPYTTDQRGVEVVVEQRPPAGTHLFRGQSVEVELIAKQPYYLICRGGGLIDQDVGKDLVRFTRHKGLPSPEMSPGSCSWTSGEIHRNQDEVIKPLGFQKDLKRLFDRAPGNMIALCVFSEYDLGAKAVKSERYAAVDYADYMMRDDNGKLVPRIGVHICVDRL
jgi:hypothetical protein